MAIQTERYVDPELLNLDGGLFQDLLLRAPINWQAVPVSSSIALAPESSSLVKIDQGWEELTAQDLVDVEEEPGEVEIEVDMSVSPQETAPISAATTLEVAVPVEVIIAQQEAAPASAASTVEVAVPVVTPQDEAPSSAGTTLEVAIPVDALSAMREPVEIIEPAPVSAVEEQPVRSQDRPTPIGVFERPTPVLPPPVSVRRWRDRRAVSGACAAAAVTAALFVFFGLGSIRMKSQQTPQPAVETPQGDPQVEMAATPPLASPAPLAVEEPPPGGATVVPPGPTLPIAPAAQPVVRTADERATGEGAMLAAAQNVNPTLYNALAAPKPFRRSAAAVAISSAGRGAKGCIAKGAAGGAVPVRVVYAPSGQVTSAAVQGGPFAGTAAGSCIARLLRGARIEPFDGSATAVTTTLRIR